MIKLRALRNGNHWGTFKNHAEVNLWFAIGPVKSNGIKGLEVRFGSHGFWIAPWWWREGVLTPHRIEWINYWGPTLIAAGWALLILSIGLFMWRNS